MTETEPPLGLAGGGVRMSETPEIPEGVTVAVVHCHDMEAYAEHFNAGFEEAQRQGIGGEGSRRWLLEKVGPILEPHFADWDDVADQLAGALLSEAELDDPEPTFTASEVKVLTETATRLGVALGRKEAQGECAAMLEERASELRGTGTGSAAILGGMAKTIRSIASRPQGAASNGLTAPIGHSDLPPTPEAGRIHIPTPTTRLEDCGVHHAYPELHHCSDCLRAYCGRAGHADLAPNPTPDLPEGRDQ